MRADFKHGVLGPNKTMHHVFRIKAAFENLLGLGISKVAGEKAAC